METNRNVVQLASLGDQCADPLADLLDVLREIRDRMPEPMPSHREATADPRYEVLRAEFTALAQAMQSAMGTWTGGAVGQEIYKVLAKVAP